ncbi:hypothetical protein BASA50_000489 [Batrachochytrium salamandrivorans]|uniref:Phosphate-induced protein 1 conserved region-domain-containing protein n=1 Tax=Batrachochytrium salamandrivorans TaxID=1357716 RepID=A0ABQ8EWU0_9FUNG|nr:hypothetical protein BASA60_011400 [Batrachochytrium salamandrivorans]KAH6568118.1 hypothetical protein BASA62_005665 [Batrachochytrium salamandrivorans]KAH6586535.1 hypothetical protein BASA50_000489 [Batrachochytrium salamandrivorans]KAH6592881.1 hypothetical protein BASA61_004430 [Batrachochytrium salamandrivorans]KAH9275397.1 hypothetical protein BASA83_002170 [Batrachochytrium salamandrivorans]
MIASTFIAALAVASVAAAPSSKRISVSPLNGPHVFASAGGDITYNMGAPLLTGPLNVYFIFYGDWTSAQKSIVTDFTSGLGRSDWWTTSKKYYYQADSSSSKVYIDGQVNVAGSVSDNYSIGKSQSGNDLGNLVQKYISDGTFPEDRNAVYYILNSEDVSEAALGSSFCSGYCGYHSSTTLKSGSEVYYALSGKLPESCISGCAPPPNQSISPNGDVGVDAMLSVLAHELTEAASDPSNNRAWNDATGYENADKCAYQYGTTTIDSNGASSNSGWNGRTFMIQMNWDPETQSCTQGSGGSTPPPPPPPKTTTTARRTTTTKKTKTKKTTTTTTTASAPTPTGDCDIMDFCCFMMGHYCD